MKKSFVLFILFSLFTTEAEAQWQPDDWAAKWAMRESQLKEVYNGKEKNEAWAKNRADQIRKFAKMMQGLKDMSASDQAEALAFLKQAPSPSPLLIEGINILDAQFSAAAKAELKVDNFTNPKVEKWLQTYADWTAGFEEVATSLKELKSKYQTLKKRNTDLNNLYSSSSKYLTDLYAFLQNGGQNPPERSVKPYIEDEKPVTEDNTASAASNKIATQSEHAKAARSAFDGLIADGIVKETKRVALIKNLLDLLQEDLARLKVTYLDESTIFITQISDLKNKNVEFNQKCKDREKAIDDAEASLHKKLAEQELDKEKDAGTAANDSNPAPSRKISSEGEKAPSPESAPMTPAPTEEIPKPTEN